MTKMEERRYRLTYRILEVGGRFVGVARDDFGLVLLGTADQDNYTTAKFELEKMVTEFAPKYNLYYFDGEIPVASL